MFKGQHLFLHIALGIDFEITELVHPYRKIPTMINATEGNRHYIGYLQSYTRVEELQSYQEYFFCNNAGFTLTWEDYLLIELDRGNKQVRISLDPGGRFPCYFAIENRNLYISTDHEQVRKHLNQVTLNISEAIRLITNSLFISDQTLIQEVSMAPPGCIVLISENDNIQIDTAPFSFKHYPERDFRSEDAFLDELLAEIHQGIKMQLDSFGSKNPMIGSHMSSGLDSTLISYILSQAGVLPQSYFIHSELSPESDRLDVARAFANKHGLDLTPFNCSSYIPFQSADDLLQLKKYPGNTNPLQGMIRRFNEMIANEDIEVVFTGEGGNEVFRMKQGASTEPYYLHHSFFALVDGLKAGLAPLFHTKMLMHVLGNDFKQESYYQPHLSASLVRANLAEFKNYWDFDLWPTMPFQSPVVMALLRNATVNGKPLPKRNELMRNKIGEIYYSEQFEVTSDYAHLIMGMFINQKEKIIKLFENSILADAKIIDIDYINAGLLNGKLVEDIVEAEMIVMLYRILSLEYYLQQNDEIEIIPLS